MNHLKNKIFCGGNLEVVSSWPSNFISAVLTDPPYGLGFMGKDWDTFKQENVNKPKTTKLTYKTDYKNGVPVRRNKPEIVTRDSGARRAGSYDLSRNPEFQQWFTVWAKAMLRITKPGGFLLCFGGTRTYHRLACAIEDAGWKIRDCMMWLYGSGFPKSHNIGKAIDKLHGAKRESLGMQKAPGYAKKEVEMGKQNRNVYDFEKTSGTSKWEGYGTALKPAWEPIIVAMKPLGGTFAHNAEKYGVAGLNIDGGRIPAQQGERFGGGGLNSSQRGFMANTQNTYKKGMGFRDDTPQGRWPANLVLDEESARLLDEQTGTLKAKGHWPDCKVTGFGNFGGGKTVYKGTGPKAQDSGGASRFFYCAKTSRKERNMGLDKSVIISIIKEWKENNITKEAKLAEISVDMDILQKKGISESGTKKENDSEWNTILFGKNIMGKYRQDLEYITGTTTNSTTKSQILNWLVTLFTKEYTETVGLLKKNGGNLVENVKDCNQFKITINEKMVSRLGAKNVVLGMQLKISVEEKGKKVNDGRKTSIDNPYQRGDTIRTNTHPTVKPLALMKYLCTLLKMPDQDQIILDPFLGSGTTGMACKELGIDFIGIEKEREYCEIAVKRIAAVPGQDITLETTLPVSKNVETFRATRDSAGGGRRPNESLPHVSESRQRIINAASAELRNRKIP